MTTPGPWQDTESITVATSPVERAGPATHSFTGTSTANDWDEAVGFTQYPDLLGDGYSTFPTSTINWVSANTVGIQAELRAFSGSHLEVIERDITSVEGQTITTAPGYTAAVTGGVAYELSFSMWINKNRVFIDTYAVPYSITITTDAGSVTHSYSFTYNGGLQVDHFFVLPSAATQVTQVAITVDNQRWGTPVSSGNSDSNVNFDQIVFRRTAAHAGPDLGEIVGETYDATQVAAHRAYAYGFWGVYTDDLDSNSDVILATTPSPVDMPGTDGIEYSGTPGRFLGDWTLVLRIAVPAAGFTAPVTLELRQVDTFSLGPLIIGPYTRAEIEALPLLDTLNVDPTLATYTEFSVIRWYRIPASTLPACYVITMPVGTAPTAGHPLGVNFILTVERQYQPQQWRYLYRDSPPSSTPPTREPQVSFMPYTNSVRHGLAPRTDSVLRVGKPDPSGGSIFEGPDANSPSYDDNEPDMDERDTESYVSSWVEFL